MTFTECIYLNQSGTTILFSLASLYQKSIWTYGRSSYALAKAYICVKYRFDQRKWPTTLSFDSSLLVYSIHIKSKLHLISINPLQPLSLAKSYLQAKLPSKMCLLSELLLFEIVCALGLNCVINFPVWFTMPQALILPNLSIIIFSFLKIVIKVPAVHEGYIWQALKLLNSFFILETESK